MNRKLALAGLVVFLGTSVAAQADLAQSLAAGDAALAGFNLDPALAAYRSAVTLDPQSYEANWKLARALVDHGMLEKDAARQKRDYVAAQDCARAAVRLNPTDSKGHVFLAIVVGKLALYHGGRTKVALSKEVKAEAERALALNAKEDVAYHVIGVWNREMVELNWMLRKFAEILYGKFPPASRDDALRNLRRAAELAPKVVAHKVEIGVTLASARQWPEAKQTLEAALAMPQTWVTDDVFRQQARETLEIVKRHAR